jgi:hypothetical protein
MIFDLALRNTVNEIYNDLYSATGLASTYATLDDVAGIIGLFFSTQTQPPPTPGDAQNVEFEITGLSQGITCDGTVIRFPTPGTYHIDFSAQVASTVSSDREFYFWPRINGIDVPGSTMIFSLHSNAATNTVSRSSVFNFSKGDTLEPMWTVNGTATSLVATAGSGAVPASPSATISICRVGI